MKNILIIDDSALMRRVISDIINSDGRFKVKDKARDGLEALEYILVKKDYDAIISDINMPRMDGLELLSELKKAKVKIPVIMVSTLVRKGADETIKALDLGAFDFVLKPDSFAEARNEDFKKGIIERLEAATGVSSKEEKTDLTSEAKKKENTLSKTVFTNPVRFSSSGKTAGKILVALACSTGGPKALQTVIPMLPAKIGAGMLMVQHMPEGFTKSLAKRLQELSLIGVKEANDGELIAENHVYLAKGGFQMRYEEQAGGGYIVLTDEPPRGGLKPCADIMYESLAGTSYEKIVCVVLTGMGSDGTEGIRQLKKTNNIYVIAQDESTSTVYGMPRAVAEAGLADEVLPLDQIAGAIVRATGVR